MKLHLLISVACLSIVSVARAATYTPVGDPGQFLESVNWCQLVPTGGCTGTLANPAAWVSNPSGKTGYGGLFYDTHAFSLTQDVYGMGLIHSSYTIDPNLYLDDTAATFDNPTNGAGAYIEAPNAGNVYVSVLLFNDVYNILTGYSWLMNFGETPGEKLFVGAASSDLEVAGVIFDVSDATTFNTVPFSMGTLEFDQVPEPGSIALVAPILLGLGVMLRKRTRKS